MEKRDLIQTYTKILRHETTFTKSGTKSSSVTSITYAYFKNKQNPYKCISHGIIEKFLEVVSLVKVGIHKPAFGIWMNHIP